MDSPLLAFSYTHREFFETLDRYQPGPELLQVVLNHCPREWSILPGGFWTYCTPPHYTAQLQGWKIHISGTRETVVGLLNRLVPVLVAERIAFKFCSDLQMVSLSTSKNWQRTAAGKIITIYPTSTANFKHIIQSCHELTSDMSGPYILTDRPYKESRVVFYRYGGHRIFFRTNSQGHRISLIRSPLGHDIPDERQPYFYLPGWERDPFDKNFSHTQVGTRTKEVVLKNGRYRVLGALRYSSLGGIYTAIDAATNEEVIVREARPLLNHSFDVVQKEARILQKLEPTGLAPRFIDLFQEWEHWFLVQEKIHAESLWGYSMSFTMGEHASRTPAELFAHLRDIICQLTRGLESIHERGIILRDLTKTNVLFTQEPGAEAIKFIDFEFAFELDRAESPVPGFTPGYGSPQQRSNRAPQVEDDYYALGALILDTIAFTASGLDLNREGILHAFRQTLGDLGLPMILAEIVENLTSSEPSLRCRPCEVESQLLKTKLPIGDSARDPLMCSHHPHFTARPITGDLNEELQQTVDGITRYILTTADYSRDDRLWPASAEVFFTSPVSIRFGATGTASYLWRVSKTIPADVISWIIRHSDQVSSPPGLYTGLSGVAVFLLHAGLTSEADEILRLANDPARIYDVPGLYDGAAGWGLANLHFWRATGESRYLEEANAVGEYLLTSVKKRDGAVFWGEGDKIPIGLGMGASGIGLFLLYLHLAQGAPEYLEIARKAVLSEISAAVWLDDRVYHHTYRDVLPTKPKSPHMRHGSGGVGTAAIRLYAVTAEETFGRFAKDCALTLTSRYTNKLWQDWGLAGFGEYLLDAFRFFKDEKYLQSALYIAEGLLPHRIYREQGIVFPGTELLKLSCDFGLGSAGIGCFLHRLLNPGTERFLLLDDLIHDVTSKPQTAALSLMGSARG